MGLSDTWAQLKAPERYPPPPLGPWSLVWRWGLAGLWLLLIVLVYFLELSGQVEGPRLGLSVAVMVTDLVLGALALGVIALRRRWPFPVALALSLFPYLSVSSAVTATWGYLSLASRRRWRPTLIVAAASVLVSLVRELTPGLTPPPTRDWLSVVISGVIVAGLLTAIGALVGVHHDRRAALLKARADAAQDREMAVVNERNRIAREMHDVLAHRMSLVAMHAGVLAYRKDLDAERTREIATIIQENARASLDELRTVLRSLREVDGQGTEPPQPTLSDLDALVADAQLQGQLVEVIDERAGNELSSVIARQAFRIVQECLTNARKHAPGTTVWLRLSGTPAQGLSLTVRNRLGVHRTDVPGAGLGLVGIGERVALVGGHWSHGVNEGNFEVKVWLPWTA